MPESKVPPSRRRSTRVTLADRAYDGLLLKIIGGELAPGERLNIGGLSREMGLSPTPIREALARLEPTGFVRRHDVRGYAVSPLLSPEEISSQIDARQIFEPAFAAAAATHCTPAFLTRLDDTISTMERAGELSDPESLKASWTADEAFHTLVSEQGGNPFMQQAFRALGSQLQRFRLSGRAGRTHALEAAHEHRLIAEAIRAGDAHAAAELMHDHIELARERTLVDAHALEESVVDEIAAR
ncbi:GntR family transcriptional regulator [Agrococcus sp. Marseille-Q4369]|uniref:GntR family transcriptional regulator n=1 Tax=Agrococcus sp. Marseille-Q4369 TaxID=2810513 RepID=UPI001B8C71E7|nr:GntR family transcriptional regulator [Agrococcus sp. Marseille-Q4369]QUW17837.1 GntR family transcriptional regulator [Agrococcus sp. Marseille-Q4369]